jgi:uncharacterized protein (DUF58 family)
MTARALGLLLLTGAAVALGEFSDWPAMNQVAMILAAVLVIALIWSWQSLTGVSVRRSVESDRVQVAQVLVDDLAVSNGGRLGKLWIEVRDRSNLPGHSASRFIGLRGRQTQKWTTQSYCVKRGVFELGPVTLRSGDPFGLFIRSREVPTRLPVTIYPPVFELPSLRFPTAAMSGGVRTEQRSHFMTPAVSTVRDYVSGDAYNKISWTASARLGRLMVKEFDLDPTAEIWIVLDMDHRGFVQATPEAIHRRNPNLPFEDAWLETTDDYAAAIGASVAHRALTANRAIGLLSSDAHRSLLQAERSDRQYVKMLELFALIRADGNTPLDEVLTAEARRFDRLRSPIVITSSENERAFAVLDTFAFRGIKPVVIFIDPTGFDPKRPPSRIVETFPERRYEIQRVDFKEGIGEAFLDRLPLAS